MSTDQQVEAAAELLYTVYCENVGGIAFNGDKLPTWTEFSVDPKKEKQANAWRASARSILQRMEVSDPIATALEWFRSVGAKPDDLCDWVFDISEDCASVVCNQGMRAQLEYIRGSFASDESFLEALKNRTSLL